MTISIKTNKDRRRALFCICVLIYAAALLIRVFELAMNPMISRDAALYLTLSDLWHESGDYTSTLLPGIIVPPLPVWTMKSLLALGFSTEVTGRTIALILGSLLPVVGFIFGLNVSGRVRIGLLTALLVMIQPELVSYSYQPLRENFYLFFDGLLLIALVDAVKRSGISKWCICGILLSLTFYCRLEALEFLALIPFIFAVLFFWKKMNVKDVIVNFSAFLFSFLITSASLLTMVDFNCIFISRILVWIGRLLHIPIE